MEACQDFLNNSLLSSRLQYIINNIELIHRCSDESDLDNELRKTAINNPVHAKIQCINRCAPEFDTNEEYFSSDNDNNQMLSCEDNENLSKFDPILIIRNGLKDINTVDTAMNYLRIRGRFPLNKLNFLFNSFSQNSKEINILNNKKNIRQSNDYDNKLLEAWRSTIISHKSSWQNIDINKTNNNLLPNTFFIPQYNNLFSIPIKNKYIDPLKKFAIGLNEKQKKPIFLYVITDKETNQPTQLNYYNYYYFLLVQVVLANQK